MHHIVNLRAHSASYVADRIQDKKKVPKITIKKKQNYIPLTLGRALAL